MKGGWLFSRHFALDHAFGCKERVSKNSLVPECLGTLDELNSFLGLCKVKAEETGFKAGEEIPDLDSLTTE